ncbi:MAG: hypothetical protein A2231_00365 [Candidatus Firestonebacteria bacterium RIFOXYA2_FULL_40_8]|nr:MAG: hypothetical protein A2231_00365 [Candidatus Firestonebacteria bacterium RIFOXYA2_FULL_40_8]
MAKTVEELEIFQESRKLAKEIYRITKNGEFSKDYSLKDQIRRSVVSIISNIAEGFERKSRVEFARFLSIAKGSCGETRVQLIVALDQNYVSEPEYEVLNETCLKIGRMVGAFIVYLKKSSE